LPRPPTTISTPACLRAATVRQLNIALVLTDLHVPDLEEMIFFAPEDGDTGATYIGFHTRPVHAETIMMVR